MPIQVDMFEVQLGSAMLLQFRLADGQVVRVLADAGVKAGSYRQNHVHKKLNEAFHTFEPRQAKRIDLIIGTHYDKDHLYGLVPIIEDPSIQIGETWLPPVANDTEIIAEEITADFTRMLSIQFSQEDGKQKLDTYLRRKADICEYVRELEQAAAARADSADSRIADRAAIHKHAATLRKIELDRSDNLIGGTGEAERYFEAHLESAARNETSLQPHDDVEIIEHNPEIITRTIERGKSGRLPVLLLDTDGIIQPIGYFGVQYENFHSEVISLTYIRRATATDAINANSLFSVVEALKKRNIPIRSEIIPDGIPLRYVWNTKKKRFVLGGHLQSDGPVLTLLGPSEGLVQKHWKRLPIGIYAMAARFSAIPIKSITPSNQLSYVAKFQFDNQSILVTGDAGCVDFRGGRRRKYYRKLLASLSKLNIIQVAHHAGNNAHFYRVLQSASYANQTEKSYLLLSHATHDQHRPSEEFRKFVGNIRSQGKEIELLFTSEPTRDKIEDYDELIAPAFGPSGDRGDVRLSFSGGSWNVDKHAIQV